MAIDDTLSSPVFPTWMEDNEVKPQIPDDDVIEERPSTQLTRESVEFDTRRTRQQTLRPRTPEPVDRSRLPLSIDIPRRLDLLSKSYHESEKFSGKQGDFLRTKLNLFADKCQRLEFPSNELARALPIMLSGAASEHYVNNLSNRGLDYSELVHRLRARFEPEAMMNRYRTEWRALSLKTIIETNSGKSLSACLEILTEKIQKLHQGLFDDVDTGFNSMRDTLQSAVTGIKECAPALMRPAATFEELVADLQQAIAIAEQTKPSRQHVFYTDRAFRRGQYPPKQSNENTSYRQREKKCFICRKLGCWSTKHTEQERSRARDNWLRRRHTSPPTMKKYHTFITEFEGNEYDEVDEVIEAMYKTSRVNDGDMCDENDPVDLCDENDLESDEDTGTSMMATQNFMAAASNPQPEEILASLADCSFEHAVVTVGSDKTNGGMVYISEERYSENVFRGIMPDTGASGMSNAGLPQARALMRLIPSLRIDDAPSTTIHFGAGSATSIGILKIPTVLGIISFQILPTTTPFLFSITDMDRMKVRLDNIRNCLIQGDLEIPVVRKWGHPWWLLEAAHSIAFHLTETQLRRLHRRFGHPSVERLSRILERIGEEFDEKTLKQLNKICHQCQMNAKAPGRFRFTVRDNHEFNHEIIVDIFYLDGLPVLHIIDSATAFQAACFLEPQKQTAKDVWDAIRCCWIDTYLGPPEWIVHDAGRNFASAEFRQYAKGMHVGIQEVPVEAHNSIGKVERYHGILRRAYMIIDSELGDVIPKHQKLQMAVKAINDSAGPDGLVPTLLVFGSYPRLTDDSPPHFSVVQRAEAIRKATHEVRKLISARQVREAVKTRNGPDTGMIHSLPLQSDVRVWREKRGWQGPYKLIAMDGETCTLEMPNGTTKFRSTVVKPYYHEDDSGDNHIQPLLDCEDKNGNGKTAKIAVVLHQKKNPPEVTHEVDDEMGQKPTRRKRGRPRRPLFDEVLFSTTTETGDLGKLIQSIDMEVFMTAKEKSDYTLAVNLRDKGIVTTPGRPFEVSDRTEIDNLLARGVFEFRPFDPIQHDGIRVFGSRMVREIKGKGTPRPYEKSRLVIRGYNDEGKALILTQSPTIQRASQRLLVAIAPSLTKRGIFLWLRDITQAYAQSTTPLQRTILAKLPDQIRDKYPTGTIMRVIKPLYGIPEAGTHWWATYSRHHLDKLGMVMSTFDPCLLISNTDKFGVIGMQTDDTLGLSDRGFYDLEDEELKKANFAAKPREILGIENPLTFNGCRLHVDVDGVITMVQKGQAQKLGIPSDNQGYVEQRARGAYLASICQPEASFDLSVAAQHKEPGKDDFRRLASRLKWQMENKERGLRFVPLELEKAKLYVFVDGSFANNKDLSSQLGYVVMIGTEKQTSENRCEITGNIVTYSSTKSKRVTRSALASELYSMVQGADVGYALNSTLEIITKQLGIPKIPMILCTDSFSLYECLVKLGTTKEKRLMIDIMALRQSYERREANEVRWIHGNDNPADAMTKASPNQALRNLIDTNKLILSMEGWVERKNKEE
ncbi:Putative Polyprotein [[Torrubiella] hemipterigena]|uniref:Putative Polyprotein n=1 Tax=[Torrubiella] hemipterigena TaxID=1531966 RepID=A0A0A1TTP6_9HYPO|nr:Putative Polyprotein [[Torrubiella] hemipterigena]